MSFKKHQEIDPYRTFRDIVVAGCLMKSKTIWNSSSIQQRGMWGLLSPLKWSCKKWRKVILTFDLTEQNDLGTWLQWTGCQVEQKSPRAIRLVQHPDVANAAAVGNGTCRCLAALRTVFALLGVIICCEGVLWAHLAVSTGAFPRHVTSVTFGVLLSPP